MTSQLLHDYKKHLDSHWAEVSPQIAADPKLVIFNHELASQIEFPTTLISPDILTASAFPTNAQPIAMAYAGHQFGNFSQSLGDGRAMLLGEIKDENGQLLDIHFKGSGKTSYSRGADGKAALGPMLREYLMGEAMHALHIPTTRALCVATTGAQIYRQNGLKPAAVLTRIAKSHIRVGTFQYFAARNEIAALKSLADYTIARHFPKLTHAQNPYIELLRAAANSQASLIAAWMGVGFIHGVMNTDNMAISGQTIDYGPCAFMDQYDAMTVFSSIDHQGRYAYVNQPRIAQWNLARFAESLLPLMAEIPDAFDQASEIVTGFEVQYQQEWLAVFCTKLGWVSRTPSDKYLIDQLLDLLKANHLDFTQFFRNLPDQLNQIDDRKSDDLHDWLVQWRMRMMQETMPVETIIDKMNLCNPIYIPRNHLVEEALIEAEEHENLTLFLDLLALVKDPFTKRAEHQRYSEAAPISLPTHVTFCGT